MVEWSWVVGGAAPAGTRQRQLTTATGRRLTLRVDGPADAQFTIRHAAGRLVADEVGKSEQPVSESAEVTPLASDLWVYRDGVALFRGRIGLEQDTIDADTHSVTFSAVDYRGMLAHRLVQIPGVTYSATDQGAIAWDLINDSQVLSGGNWGVTDGVGSTSGTNRDRTYEVGKPIGEAVAELGRVDGGFEWEINASLALNRYYPTMGVNNGVVLDYGGAVTGVSRLLSPSGFGNSVIVTGSQETTAVDEVTAGIGSDARGRWELFAGFPSIIEQATLAGRGVWYLGQVSTLRPEIAVALRPGFWQGVSHIGKGDTVKLAVQSGRLAFQTSHRVVEIGIVPNDDDQGEVVHLGLVAA